MSHKYKFSRLALGCCFLFLVASLFYGAASAQSSPAPMVFLYSLESSAFPLISSLLDVFDSQGNFVTGLQKEELAIIEDGRILPIESLQQQGRPLHIVVAINPGPALGMRDAQGITRFEKVANVLLTWAQTRPIASEDRLSLVSMGGIIIGQATYQDWANSLNAFRPNFLRTTPNLQVLNLAFETLAQHPPLAGGKRAILLITPHMDQAGIELAMKPFAERAHQEGVRVYVWVVDAETYFSHPSTQAFQVLAFETGGKSFLFSGRESLPDPETYFAPLRYVYALSYRSQVNRSGAHNVRLQVQKGELSAVSNEQSFTIEILPPQPMLSVPSWQITRQPSPDDPWNDESLLPQEQVLDVSVSFPDGHPRPLQFLRLYVDGQMVAENLAENDHPPLMQFRWDLRSYRLSAQHYLVVEAADSLGLIGQSQALPVTVSVILPPRGWRAFLARYSLQIAVISGALILLLGIWGMVGTRWQASRATRRLQGHTDPLTQPVEIIPSRASRMPASRMPSPVSLQEAPLQALDAEAYLLRLSPQGRPSGTALPLRVKELIFGSDPRQVNVVLHDPSVSPVHARLRRMEDGFRLFDLGSVAGTWVNYEPVPEDGRLLQPGDLIHFGRLRYRFEMLNAPPPPEPLILLLDEKRS